MLDEADNLFARRADDLMGLIKAASIIATDMGNHADAQDALLTVLRLAERNALEIQILSDDKARGGDHGG
jgi:hypothetical protein